MNEFESRAITAKELDLQAKLAKEAKKEFHLCKDDGFWYWSDKDESSTPENWHGPFLLFGDCLFDSVEPYAGDDPSEGGFNADSDILHSKPKE